MAFSPPTLYSGNRFVLSSPRTSQAGGTYFVQKNRLASLKMIDASGILFNIDQMADSLVINQLQHLSPISALVLYGAGIATSLSPCALSVLPLTIGYLGGSQKEGNSALLPAIAFTLGLASVLSVLGLLASSFGNIYGTLVTVSTSSTAINPFYRY